MGKSAARQGHASVTPANLKPAILAATQQGRTKHALELAKQLYKNDPTADHHRLLLDTYLARARQLHQESMSRDAATLLEHAQALAGNDHAWLAQAAELLAACGQAQQALTILQSGPPSPNQERVLAQVVDQAMSRGLGGRDQLPEELRPTFDQLCGVWADYEAGRDDAARAGLQQIGARSPFLDWKLLVRGLLAWSTNDDARALDNWRRLDPARLPSRLAAPLRARIDAEFQLGQSPEAQAALRARGERLLPNPLIAPLRQLQAALADVDHPHRALNLAKTVTTLLREQPAQLAQVRDSLFWFLARCGSPKDVESFTKLFDIPAASADVARLAAMCSENNDAMDMAHRFWQAFQAKVADEPERWHGHADQVRALVWHRMGKNAAMIPDDDLVPPFLRNHPDRPQQLRPTAVECFQKSLELWPDRLRTHQSLIEHYQQQNQPKKEEQALRGLLERIPGNVEALEALGELLRKRRAYQEAADCYERAAQANPLNKRLLDWQQFCQLGLARGHVEAKRFDAARAIYQALTENPDRATVQIKWAALEFKAKQPERAEELLAQAAVATPALLLAYQMTVESIRLKLPAAVKKRFDQQFTTGLESAAKPELAELLVATAASYHLAEVEYTGQKTHEKKILAYAQQLRAADLTVEQGHSLTGALVVLRAKKVLQRFLPGLRSRYPTDPYWWFIEAEYHFQEGPQRCQPHIVMPLLTRAAALAKARPAGDPGRELLKEIDQRQSLMQQTDSLGGMMGELLGQLMGGGMPEIDMDDDDFEPAFSFLPPPRRRKR